MEISDLVEDEYVKGTHDKLVKQVVQRLINSELYEIVKHCVKYKNKYKGVEGEADVLAKAGNRYFAFEVKCNSFKYNHAKHQLNKDEDFIHDYIDKNCNVYKFFVTKDKAYNPVYKLVQCEEQGHKWHNNCKKRKK